MRSAQIMSRSLSRTGSVVRGTSAARAVVVTDTLEDGTVQLIQLVAKECRIELEMVVSMSELETELGRRCADVVLISTESPLAPQFCELVREKSGVRTAIIGLCKHVTELTYGELLCWGGDDLVSRYSEPGIRARLRSVRDDLVHADAQRPIITESMTFLLYGPECAEAGPVARHLGHAGHRVVPLKSADEVERHLRAGPIVRLVVDARSAGAPGLVKTALSTNSCVNVVLTSAPQLINDLRKRYEGDPKVTVIDSYAPPDAVLLVVNDMKGSGQNRRGTERALYSSLAAFRPVGHPRDELGFVHNISEGGLYLRTLVKPEGELAWVEVTPPGSPDRVRLEVKIAWRTPLARHRETRVPTGFGGQIVDGTRSSLEQWKEGYQRLMAIHDNRRTTSMGNSPIVPWGSQVPIEAPALVC